MKLQRKNRLRAITAGALAVSGVLVLTACGSDNNNESGGGGSKAASNIKCDGKGQLLASGSSAQKNAMDLWIKTYGAACKDTKLNYKATGSGAGIQEFLQGKTAFAGSDSALKPRRSSPPRRSARAARPLTCRWSVARSPSASTCPASTS